MNVKNIVAKITLGGAEKIAVDITPKTWYVLISIQEAGAFEASIHNCFNEPFMKEFFTVSVEFLMDVPEGEHTTPKTKFVDELEYMLNEMMQKTVLTEEDKEREEEAPSEEDNYKTGNCVISEDAMTRISAVAALFNITKEKAVDLMTEKMMDDIFMNNKDNKPVTVDEAILALLEKEDIENLSLASELTGKAPQDIVKDAFAIGLYYIMTHMFDEELLQKHIYVKE